MQIKYTLFVMVFLMIASASALDSLGTFKQGDTVRVAQVCSDATYINISSISYPNSTLAVSGIGMSPLSSGEFYYDFLLTGVKGRYDIRGISDGCEKTFATYFIVTPNGEDSYGWSIALQLFISASTLVLMFLFLHLANSNIKAAKTSGEEKPAVTLFFMGVSLVFLVAHIVITNVIVHETLGVGVISGAYTNVMYIFFTIIIAIFLFTMFRVTVNVMDMFQRRLGLK